MKRIFQHPGTPYDERTLPVDEQLCELLRNRKSLTVGKPAYPPFERIAEWSAKYGLYEDYLKAVFGTLYGEEHYRPAVEPAGFVKHLPVMKSQAAESIFYALTSILQYENASVLTIFMHWDVTAGDQFRQRRQNIGDLRLTYDGGRSYDCRFSGGSSSEGNATSTYVITPPLPDNLEGLRLSLPSLEPDTADVVILL